MKPLGKWTDLELFTLCFMFSGWNNATAYKLLSLWTDRNTHIRLKTLPSRLRWRGVLIIDIWKFA